ncbi:MAG: hypothetical protein BGO09_01105 [Bacteroidetes bacterium 47-18]|nr:MAG: hypothetical protein BGO09_01105 [Bacteroidetes bacterium 47-18]
MAEWSSLIKPYRVVGKEHQQRSEKVLQVIRVVDQALGKQGTLQPRSAMYYIVWSFRTDVRNLLYRLAASRTCPMVALLLFT